jgi:hypothetical protein
MGVKPLRKIEIAALDPYATRALNPRTFNICPRASAVVRLSSMINASDI